MSEGTIKGVNVEGPDLSDPEARAELSSRVCLPIWRKHNDYVDFWEVINEQDPADHMLLARFFLRLIELCEPYGIKLALFSYSMGVPEDYEWDAIAETGILEAWRDGGHAIAVHEYGWMARQCPDTSCAALTICTRRTRRARRRGLWWLDIPLSCD